MNNVKRMVFIAMMAAVLCVLSPFSLPVGPVPISLATFGVMLCGALLGPVGTVSVLVYLLLGAAGLPVFAGFAGGLSRFVGPTGGYLAGYLPLCLVTGIFAGIAWKREKAARFLLLIAGMVLGTAVLYCLGTVWFMAMSGKALAAALSLCVLPFLPGDAVKIIAVALLWPKLYAAIRKAMAQE